MSKIKIAFRPYAVTDVNFIISNWLHSWINAPFNFGVHKHVYYRTAELYIKETLERSGAIVACDPSDPDELFGFIVGEYMEDETVIHWIFVKASYRNYGIGGALFDHIHRSETPPFTTSYCPYYENVSELFKRTNSDRDLDTLYYQVKKHLRELPKIRLIDEHDNVLVEINKNSMVYSIEKTTFKRNKYPVIYSPHLIARLHKCKTRPIATMVE